MGFFILPVILLTLFLIFGFIWLTPELRANYFLWRGNERKARKLFEYLLNQNPEKMSIYRKLAQIYYLQNRKDKKAIKIFEIMLKLKIPFEWKNEIMPIVAKHYILEGRKDSEAIKLIEKTVEKELENLSEKSSLKSNVLNLNLCNKPIMPTIEVKKHKDLIIMLIALGDAYLEKGLYAEAVKRYQQLLALKVANRHIYTNLGKAYIGLKRLDKQALEIYQKAIHYDPNNSEIYNTLATSFLRDGREDAQAMQIYKIALQFDTPIFQELAHFLSLHYFKINEYRKCIEVTERLLNKKGYQSQSCELFINSCWKTGQFNEAIIQLKKLIDVTENNTILLKNLCTTYLEKQFNGSIQNQSSKFSYVDRQLTAEYLKRIKHFDTLKDISLFLELKRFYSDKEIWGYAEPIRNDTEQSNFVYYEDQEISHKNPTTQSSKPISFDIRKEVFEKLNLFGSTLYPSASAHSSLTYDDFEKEGAAIFTAREIESHAPNIPEQAEIIVTLVFRNFEQIRTHYGNEQIQLLRNKFNVILTDILEKYKIANTFCLADGLLLFVNDTQAATTISIELLNKLNKYNFISEPKDEIHVTIGIHHSRQALSENSEQSLKDLSIGLKVGIVTEKDLNSEDHPMYGKIFQKTDRIFLSGKAYREIKSSNRFKVNTIGQFNFKYLKEKLVLHEIGWRNPIDDLRFGFIKKLGRFDLITEIGNKGSIKIFKAKDSVLQRFVILKVVQSETFNSLPSNNSQKQKFYQFAKSLGQMSHPNITNIYEVDEDQGLTYIASEFVEGISISQIFKNGAPFNPDRLLKLIYQICKALQYCHRLGFYHLNLKPENIRLGINDELKIMDFQLPNTLLNDYEQYKEDYTHIYYKSPEQIQGIQVDGRSDIFTLGIILYEIVTQVHPFVCKNIEDGIYAILNKIPNPPSKINSQISKFNEAFILKCMAKNPENRFQSADQMVTLLKKTFEGSLFSNFNYQLAQSRDSY